MMIKIAKKEEIKDELKNIELVKAEAIAYFDRCVRTKIN